MAVNVYCICSNNNNRSYILQKNFSYRSKEIGEDFIKPYLDIKAEKGAFNKVSESLEKMNINCHGEDAEELLKKLSDEGNTFIYDPNKRIDTIITNSQSPELVLVDTDECKIVIDKNISEEKDTKRIFDKITKKVEVKISPKLFSSYNVVFLDKTFEVIYIKDDSTKNGFAIDLSNCKIFINPFNQDISKYTVSFLHVYIAVEIACIQAGNTTENKLMKKYLLDFLGADTKNIEKKQSITIKFHNALMPVGQ